MDYTAYVPLAGIDGCLNVSRDWVCFFTYRAGNRQIIDQVIQADFERTRIVVLVRQIDFALSAEGVVF